MNLISKLKAVDIEIAVARHFGIRKNLIVPNVALGIKIHECDLLIITKSGLAYEVEIKVSKADLIADLSKKHHHNDERIKRLYFAIPKEIESEIEKIPPEAGVLTIERRWVRDICQKLILHACVKCIREAKNKSNYKFSDKEKYAVARLGTMRIWELKKKLIGKGKIL